MPDPTCLASVAMQIIGTLYAIFIAVAILGIQTISTIGNINSTKVSQEFYNNVIENIPKLQILNLVLAYFVFFVEFSCGAYIYYMSGPTIILLSLYLLFIVAIVYIIFISHHLIDYFLLAVTGKYRGFNVKKFEWVGKYDFFKGTSLIVSAFGAIVSYPIIFPNYATIDLFPAVVSFFIGLMAYAISTSIFK